MSMFVLGDPSQEPGGILVISAGSGRRACEHIRVSVPCSFCLANGIKFCSLRLPRMNFHIHHLH